ncbi:MAG TPA: DUF58 domain-containing protein [Dehalococcoidia bacterium]|nr:DUF58 domain-containing protein [Dehalococcoidia bacterium]
MRGGYLPTIVVVLFLIGVILGQVPLILVAFLLLLVWGTTRLWERYALTRIEYRRRLSAKRAFFGEELLLELEIANRKPLPLPWVEIDDEMPEDITFLKGKTTQSHKVDRVHLTSLLSLGWYHRVTRLYPIRCDQRGYFNFGPTRIRSGDLFGFSRQEIEVSDVNQLIVYPRIVPVEQRGIPSKQPVGDIRTKRHIFQDPILTMGVRDYHFGDSLKRIHWKTTARLGKLQTKVFEPTTSVDMGIFLDVRTVQPPGWGAVTQSLELGVMAAASIASHAMSNGYRVGLYANQRRKPVGELVRIPPSQHTDQLVYILEALAQIHSSESMPIGRFVSLESRNLPWGSTLVLITAVPTESLLATLLRMKRVGRQVALVIIGSSKIPRMDGLPVYHISDNTPWREVETLNLQGTAQ